MTEFRDPDAIDFGPPAPHEYVGPVAVLPARTLVVRERGVWLERASDLLAEPDPGPTPFLVDKLLADRCLGAIQGAPKIGKTWVVLECGAAIVTGRPAFGRFQIPLPGPVIVILAEAGRAALHRRLDSLARGYALGSDALADLHFAANRRVRLDDAAWQNDILDAAKEIRPRAVFLDPLARLKASLRDENLQKDIAPVLEFLRDLRDEAGTAVPFVHHTGHGAPGMIVLDFDSDGCLFGIEVLPASRLLPPELMESKDTNIRRIP